ncbi:DUF4097 family beta strand repeat-containing protein [Paenibacillus sp. GCM10012303]|jgi:hypothetical protein|uniref:DUF4097 family beta strand repeat-containing protein n=1 Tax=Paenibacillus sp. GCM10012303 TaxID=3317340 RepID=UPI003611DE8A
MWKRWGLPVLLAGMIGITGCGFAMKEGKRELELPAQSIETLQVDTASGDFTIKGDDQADSIRAVATIRSAQGAEDKAVVFTLEKDGKTAKLASRFKSEFGFNNRSMDITVTVPSKLNVTVDDESGDLHISDIQGDVSIIDQSGDMVVKGVQGKIEIKDQSGDIELTGSSGDVKIDDQSGDMKIRNHTGDVTINDESGEIELRDINGSVVIDDESGDIIIRGVEKDVTIRSDGSGGVEVSDVKGSYTNKE